MRPGVIWLTGLSGAGKTTLARALVAQWLSQGRPAVVLDGDVMRQGLCRDLGFSPQQRTENIRRVAEVAHLMREAGLIVVVALISPFAHDRAMVRRIVGERYFFEVWVNTPLALCEQRDVKGLYRRARQGQIKEMTGIDSPYEIPTHPHAVVDGHQPVAQSLPVLMNACEVWMAAQADEGEQ